MKAADNLLPRWGAGIVALAVQFDYCRRRYLSCYALFEAGAGMRYFLDTEFNGFCGELISIALVPEEPGGAPFYQAIAIDEPVQWVRDNVLSVLETEQRLRKVVTDLFGAYLANDPDPLLVADWPEDIALAARLLVTGPGYMKPVRSLRFELVDPDIIGPMVPSAIPHNAYHDAVALRATVSAASRKSPPKTKEAGTTALLLLPTSSRQKCGISRPIQLMMPKRLTTQAEISVAQRMQTALRRATGIPRLRASSSGMQSAFIFQRRI